MKQKCWNTEECMRSIVCQRCGWCLMHCCCPPLRLRADVAAILAESIRRRSEKISLADWWERNGSFSVLARQTSPAGRDCHFGRVRAQSEFSPSSVRAGVRVANPGEATPNSPHPDPPR